MNDPVETQTAEPEVVVALTDAAVDKVKQLIGDHDDSVLRIGVLAGGCSGFNYHLALDHLQPDDDPYEVDGVRVVVDPWAVPYLKGSTLDYRETLNEMGFVFDNPNATGTCGCGSSFRVDGKDGCDAEPSVGTFDEIYGV